MTRYPRSIRVDTSRRKPAASITALLIGLSCSESRRDTRCLGPIGVGQRSSAASQPLGITMPLDPKFWDLWPYCLPAAVSNVAGMSVESQPISILSETESWNLLSSVALGRLVT